MKVRWSLWPERARQLEILVDWQPRDQRNLLMCLSRRIYNWFFFIFVGLGPVFQTQRRLQVCACCCCYQTRSGNRISLDFWVTFQITAAKRTKLLRPWIEFFTRLVFFLAYCDKHTDRKEEKNYFFFICIKSSKVLSLCLFIMDREISCLLLKKNVNNVYFSTKKPLKALTSE